MSFTNPPRIAMWMLTHLTPSGHDEALAGDLLESFRAGRSSAWYCRQVLAALVIRWMGYLFRQGTVVIFAAAWAMISPAWRLVITRLHHSGNLFGPMWRLPWPWSTVCSFGLSTVEGLLFIWTGALLGLILIRSCLGNAKNWRIGRAFVLSAVSYILAFVCLVAVSLIAAPYPTVRGVDWRTLTLSGVITDFGMWTNLLRLPYIAGTACALWGAVPTRERNIKLAE
jgi:hypothetical protein